MERVVGSSVNHVIPSNYREAVEALNAARPVVLGKSQLAESLRRLAVDVGGIQKPPGGQRSTGGVLGRLAFRRA